MTTPLGSNWELEAGKRKRSWAGSHDASHAAVVLGNSEKFRALVGLFIDTPQLRATRDELTARLGEAVPGLAMGKMSVQNSRKALGQRAYHRADLRLNPISADESAGPGGWVWFIRPEVREAFAQAL